MNAIDWRAELERLHDVSFAWSLYCCRYRTEEAEEVLQDVYIRVLEGRARFDSRSSAKTWLFGVIRHTARERVRRRWLRSMLLDRWHRQELDRASAPDPAQLVRQFELNEKLRTSVMKLPRRQQEVLHLVFYQDLTIEESANMLGISMGTARTHFERGKQCLREMLKGDDAL